MRVLAIAASPGDAEFACGGTLARVTRDDDGATAICTIANGNSTGADVPPRDLADTRRAEAEAAAGILGAELYWLNHSDFGVSGDSVTRVKVADVLRAFRADVVLAPAALGPSRDARAAGALALGAAELAAAANARSEHPALGAPPHVLSYAPGWAAGFVPTEYVDVTETQELKRRALEAHATLLVWRREREGIDLVQAAAAVAACRGLQAGVAAAEAFCLDPTSGRAPTRRLLP